jgi:hypothetical protein
MAIICNGIFSNQECQYEVEIKHSGQLSLSLPSETDVMSDSDYSQYSEM